jgi:predicted glycosyltransferase
LQQWSFCRLPVLHSKDADRKRQVRVGERKREYNEYREVKKLAVVSNFHGESGSLRALKLHVTELFI